MTEKDAIEILVDIATKRRPHDRQTVATAVRVIEPVPVIVRKQTGVTHNAD